MIWGRLRARVFGRPRPVYTPVGCGGKSRLAENELAWSDDMRLRCDRGEGRIGGQIVDRTNMAIRNGRRVCSSIRT